VGQFGFELAQVLQTIQGEAKMKIEKAIRCAYNHREKAHLSFYSFADLYGLAALFMIADLERIISSPKSGKKASLVRSKR
jgi:hypothetical protein